MHFQVYIYFFNCLLSKAFKYIQTNQFTSKRGHIKLALLSGYQISNSDLERYNKWVRQWVSMFWVLSC